MSKRRRATYPHRWQQLLLGPAESFEARVTQGAAFGTFAASIGLLVGVLRGATAWVLGAFLACVLLDLGVVAWSMWHRIRRGSWRLTWLAWSVPLLWVVAIGIDRSHG